MSVARDFQPVGRRLESLRHGHQTLSRIEEAFISLIRKRQREG